MKNVVLNFILTLIFSCDLFAGTLSFSSVIFYQAKIIVATSEKSEGQFLKSSLATLTLKDKKFSDLKKIELDKLIQAREILAIIPLTQVDNYLFITQNPNGGGDKIEIYQQKLDKINAQFISKSDCISLTKIKLEKSFLTLICRNYPANGEELKNFKIEVKNFDSMKNITIEIPFLYSDKDDVHLNISDFNLSLMDKFSVSESNLTNSVDFKIDQFQ